MTAFRGVRDADEVDAVLREATVPIRLATRRPDESPWAVTPRYRYRDGSFECATGANADVVCFLRRDSQVGFDVSTNRPPTAGSGGTGPRRRRPTGGRRRCAT